MKGNSRLLIYDEVASTQDVARELATQGAPDGLAVMALSQTAGRGRTGRKWTSPPGRNLALTVILRPSVDGGDAPLLGLLTSLAVAEAIEELGAAVTQLKWPNDVLVEEKKIAGILPEATVSGSKVEYVLMGVGLNVNTRESDFPPDLSYPATSMLLCSGKRWDLQEVAEALLKRMDLLLDRVKREGCSFVPGLWEPRWAHRGMEMTREGLTGTAVGIAPDGGLMLRVGAGRVVELNCGEVQPKRAD